MVSRHLVPSLPSAILLSLLSLPLSLPLVFSLPPRLSQAPYMLLLLYSFTPLRLKLGASQHKCLLGKCYVPDSPLNTGKKDLQILAFMKSTVS